MKKLIFLKFIKDTLIFFTLMCLVVGIIVWTLQAVNYFDFVVQDGHGLKTYFSYTILNFPKIIHRIIPFIFFISLFYMLINYKKCLSWCNVWLLSWFSKELCSWRPTMISFAPVGIGEFFNSLPASSCWMRYWIVSTFLFKNLKL